MQLFDYSKEPLRDILAIDAKSFYASCECISRGLNPLNTMLVVLSTADNTGNGLVLAASPLAKKKLNISNVCRAEDIPYHPDLILAQPRMDFYIKENMKLNAIFKRFVADEDLLIYSIDESLLDVTKTLNLFFPDATLSRSEKRKEFAKLILKTVTDELGLFLTIGIGDNPLLAKLALDNESKYAANYISEWRYQDVPNKVWQIEPMTDFWGIGRRMAKQFNQIGILTIKDLAHYNPIRLKERFGIMGLQYFHHAHGIDRTILAEPAPKPKDTSLGNSQVLPRNYHKQAEIETVLKEMAEQVATRIRREGYQTECVRIAIGFAYHENGSGFSRQLKIPRTNSTKILTEHCLFLFRKNYQGQEVRHISVHYSKLVHSTAQQLDLFVPFEENLKDYALDQVIDNIRKQYGFTALIHANSLTDGARSITRSELIGGHRGGAGGLDGL